MTKKHKACHDIEPLCAAILQLLNDPGVQETVQEIGATEQLTLVALATEGLAGRAQVVHYQCLNEEGQQPGTIH